MGRGARASVAQPTSVKGFTKALPSLARPLGRARALSFHDRREEGETMKVLIALLGAEKIGIELSEEFQLHPEQSTSAIVVHHPQAKYFNI